MLVENTLLPQPGLELGGRAQAQHLPQVQGAMRGMGLVVAALIVTTALKLAPALRTHPGGRTFCVLVAMATAVCVVWLKWPLLWVLLSVGGLSTLWTWRCLQQADGAA